MEEKQKPCQCGKPTVHQAIPIGFEGRVICATPGCGGYIQYPRPKEIFKGTDPIEKFLFDLNDASPQMTPEKAIIIMLLRVEELLKIIKTGQVPKGPEVLPHKPKEKA